MSVYNVRFQTSDATKREAYKPKRSNTTKIIDKLHKISSTKRKIIIASSKRKNH